MDGISGSYVPHPQHLVTPAADNEGIRLAPSVRRRAGRASFAREGYRSRLSDGEVKPERGAPHCWDIVRADRVVPVSDPRTAAADKTDAPNACVVADKRAREDTCTTAEYVDLAVRETDDDPILIKRDGRDDVD